MALDLSTVTKFPYYKVVNVSNSTCTEIILPKTCRRLELGCEAHKIYVAQNGAADGVALPTDKFFIPKNNAKSISIGQGAERIDSIFVQTSGGAADVSIELSER